MAILSTLCYVFGLLVVAVGLLAFCSGRALLNSCVRDKADIFFLQRLGNRAVTGYYQATGQPASTDKDPVRCGSALFGVGLGLVILGLVFSMLAAKI